MLHACFPFCSHTHQVVFRDGENALQVFPPLVEVLPEARLNLIIHHLRNDELQQAFMLVKTLEPSTPQVCNACSINRLPLNQSIRVILSLVAV
jgi:hypothetical protein